MPKCSEEACQPRPKWKGESVEHVVRAFESHAFFSFIELKACHPEADRESCLLECLMFLEEIESLPSPARK